MTNIKFGTDGWRAVIAKDFTVDNVAKVAKATAKWLLNKYQQPSVVIGYDTRFGGKLFSETTAKVLAPMGINVFISDNFVSTPMVSLAILKLKANLGVVITASHNPADYNGYKLKGEHGGPLLDNDVKDIESLISDTDDIYLDLLKWQEFIDKRMIQYIDLESIYIEHIKENFNIQTIKNSKFRFAFDAMYGSGQNVFKRILPKIVMLHCENNPTFKGIAPEPLHKNLQEFSNLIKKKNIDCGLAVDGDADRLALFDEQGNYIDSHHIILLLIHYLTKYKGLKGNVVTGFSSTVKVEKLCKHYHLDVQRVRIGFKDICKVMLNDDVLVGGEESGGITIKNHIPERDGIWMGLTIWQFMVETGKSLSKLIDEVYNITGKFAFERADLKIDENLKKKIVDKCKNREYLSFGDYKVKWVEDLDGYKFFFNESEWLMIRPSGTEPVLRTYAESLTQEKAKDILSSAYKTIIEY